MRQLTPKVEIKTVSVVGYLQLGLGELNIEFVDQFGVTVNHQEGANRVKWECDWPVEAYDPKYLFMDDLKKGTMSEDNPQYLQMRIGTHGRELSCGKPKLMCRRNLYANLLCSIIR